MSNTLGALLARFPSAPTDIPPELILGQRNGKLSLTLGGRAVHSLFNPTKEAKQVIEQVFAVPPSAFVAFGTGLGYILEEACAYSPELPIVVFEPCPPWIPKAKELNPHFTCWTAPNVQWFGPGEEDQLARALQEAHPASLAVHHVNAWSQFWPEQSAAIQELADACRFRRQVNVNTLHKFGKLWVRNLLRNRQRGVDGGLNHPHAARRNERGDRASIQN